MSTAGLTSLVVDGVVSDEKLFELRAPDRVPELDFERTSDLSITRDVGELDGADPRAFDEARLTPKMLEYFRLRSSCGPASPSAADTRSASSTSVHTPAATPSRRSVSARARRARSNATYVELAR